VRRRIELEGCIGGVGFASGDRFVIGLWRSGPLGPMTDVMWAQPDGKRVLLAPSKEAADFIGSIYDFDELRVVDLHVRESAGGFDVSAGGLRVEARGGPPSRLFALRPPWLRRSLMWVRVEDFLLRRAIGRLLLGGAEGVRAVGRTRSGIREWYRIDSYRPIVAARATVDRRDLGPLRPLVPPLGFGFSEFPRRPAIVACSPVLEGTFG
jgi:hypothetical protein